MYGRYAFVGEMPNLQQHIQVLEALDPRRANEAAQAQQQGEQQARAAARLEVMRAQQQVRQEIVEEAQQNVRRFYNHQAQDQAQQAREQAQQAREQAEQNARRLLNQIHGYVNGPGVPPPAHALGPWMVPMDPLPNDPPGAAAHPPPRVVRQRTNPFVDQRQPGIADQAPHRTGTLLPGMGHVNPGLLQNAAFDGIDNPWQMEALRMDIRPLQPANQDNPIFAPMPQPQAQGWNPVGDPNWNLLGNPDGMPPVPPVPPMVNGEQQGLEFVGVIADWPEVINSQPVWR